LNRGKLTNFANIYKIVTFSKAREIYFWFLLMLDRDNVRRSGAITVTGARLARTAIVLSRPIGNSFLWSRLLLGGLALICCLWHACDLTCYARLLLHGRSGCLIQSIVAGLLLHLIHHLLQSGGVLHQLLQMRWVHALLLQHLIHHDLVDELLLLLIGRCRSWEPRFVIKALLELGHCGILLERCLLYVSCRNIWRCHQILTLWNL
jgi:hypothetical protein